jgi:large subunit ribosomal protein L4e
MFAPTKVWRKWHRHVNLKQRRFALTSALAASALPSLVLARGHKIENVPEIPLVVSNDDVKNLEKTKDALALLTKLNANDDVEHAKESRKIRSGKGKMRNRRYVLRRGPLIIYDEAGPLTRAFRNIPGVELCHVTRLNLLQLAPGGHLGRFIVWTSGAFAQLDKLYGTETTGSELKKGFHLPHGKMTNADLNRIINSDEIQSIVRPQQHQQRFHSRRRNPLKNVGFMIKLNPYALTERRKAILEAGKRKKPTKTAAVKAFKSEKARTKSRAPYYKSLLE